MGGGVGSVGGRKDGVEGDSAVASPSRHNERGCAERGRGAKVAGFDAFDGVGRKKADRGRLAQRACWPPVNDGTEWEPRIDVRAYQDEF